MDKRTERFIVQGRVQGVGFRNYVFISAGTLDIDGYVRNRGDGSVECVARGGDGELGRLYDLLRRGPQLSRVDQVHRYESQEILPPGFQIRY